MSIHNVELDTSHVLVSVLGGSLEGSFQEVLDLIEVLDGGGLIEKKVGAGDIGTKTPDLHEFVIVHSLVRV